MNNSEGQTQEPVKIFIADFKNKALREKEYVPQTEEEYNDSRPIASEGGSPYKYKQYPATWLTPEMDGKEFIEGKDFEIYDNADYTSGYEGAPKLMAIPFKAGYAASQNNE